MGFFNLDGPVYRIASIIADIMILGLLWLILALPIVTIGASTTAVFYVFTKRVNGKDGYLWRDFWTSFRQNFFTATAVWLTLLLVYTVLLFNIVNAGLLDGMANAILIVQFVILIQVSFITIFIFPLLSRFKLGYRALFKTAFFLANRHILITISNAVLLVSVILISLLQPIILVIAAGIYCYFASFLFVKAFKKYRPELDVEAGIDVLAPLQLDDDDEKGDSMEVALEPNDESEENESYDEPYYDNNSQVLNLERLKNIQDNKE
ncbi:MAG: DUF624 domain-containing protein [Defluviitaleaceae bacterium]|nr:DUF624 domain-containing protein [Defluviitaleaceae bacterium]